jgi:hypothetical protein
MATVETISREVGSSTRGVATSSAVPRNARTEPAA